jgi:hypothetical protein
VKVKTDQAKNAPIYTQINTKKNDPDGNKGVVGHKGIKPEDIHIVETKPEEPAEKEGIPCLIGLKKNHEKGNERPID